MHKFEEFLESMKVHNPALIESIERGFKVWLESEYGDDLAGLEHVTDQYYYDPKHGQYYDRSSDVYLDKTDTTVHVLLEFKSRAQQRNDRVLRLLVEDGIISSKHLPRNLGRRTWDDELSRTIDKRLREQGKNLSEYFERAK